MCSIALAGLALGAGSAAASYAGQRQQAKQQARYQAQASAAERQRALQEHRSIRMREAQEQTARNTEIQRIAQKAKEARSTATVSAGESGVTGLSVDALLDAYTQQEAQQIARLNQQGEMSDLQTGLALTDAGFRSQNRLININRPINRPSFLTAALDAGSRGLSGYRTGLELQRSMDGGSSSIPTGSKYLSKTDQYTDPYYS